MIEGGTAGCSTVWIDVAPRLLIGHRYVLFLYPSRTSDGVVHVDRLELERDAWPIDVDDVVSTPNGPMSLADLAAAIGRVAARAGR